VYRTSVNSGCIITALHCLIKDTNVCRTVIQLMFAVDVKLGLSSYEGDTGGGGGGGRRRSMSSGLCLPVGL
jgi:hypothetical protein